MLTLCVCVCQCHGWSLKAKAMAFVIIGCFVGYMLRLNVYGPWFTLLNTVIVVYVDSLHCRAQKELYAQSCNKELYHVNDGMREAKCNGWGGWYTPTHTANDEGSTVHPLPGALTRGRQGSISCTTFIWICRAPSL